MITPMKRRFITCLTCLAFIAVCPAQLFSQIKYTSNGNFGIGTTNPQYLIHILDDDPVLLFESTLNHNNIIRMAEGASQTGPGEVIIPANELKPGIYIYNLIVDAKVVDTKQMILTE